MALRGASTRITILPVFRRHWVYYCDSKAPPPSTPGERAYAALAARASAQWDELQRAAPGSWRDVARRGAEHALDASRDPDESFLGAAAGEGDVPVEIVYPASLPERLVRRRLRRLAAECLPGPVKGRDLLLKLAVDNADPGPELIAGPLYLWAVFPMLRWCGGRRDRSSSGGAIEPTLWSAS